MSNEITNSEDLIDSRDVIARLAELDDWQTSLIDDYKAAEAAYNADWFSDGAEYSEALSNAINALCSFWGIVPEEVSAGVEAIDNPADWFKGHEELRNLKALTEEGSNSADDWQYGATLIRDSYFEDYAQELADECSPAPKDQHGNTIWPYTCIDWDAAATALKGDYTSIDFDGETYWIR